jgi:hypothetical protein
MMLLYKEEGAGYVAREVGPLILNSTAVFCGSQFKRRTAVVEKAEELGAAAAGGAVLGVCRQSRARLRLLLLQEIQEVIHTCIVKMTLAVVWKET